MSLPLLHAGPAAVGGGNSLLTGVIASWNFDESVSGTSEADNSGNGYTGTWAAAVSYVPALINNGAHPVNNYATLAKVPPAGDYTFSGWVFLTALAFNGIFNISGTYDTFALETTSSGLITARVANTSGTYYTATTANAFAANTWANATATYKASTGVLSVMLNNGAPVSATLAGSPYVATDAHLCAWANTGSAMTGLVDVFTLWDRVLTPAEITAYYNGGAGVQLF